MKKYLFVFSLSLFVVQINAQQDETINGTTFKLDGKVGIGTTTPSEKLEIRGGDGVGISLFNDQANYWDIKNSLLGKLDFVRGKSNIFMRITQNGYVGIGTENPSHLFSLGNNANVVNLFKVDGISSDVSFNGKHTNGNIWSFVNTGIGSGTRLYVEDANNSSSRLTFDFKGSGGATNIIAGTSAGNVGIGTTIPSAGLEIFKGNTNSLALLLKSSGAGWGSGLQLENTSGNKYGIYSGSDGKWHFSHEGQGDRFVVDASGNMGIGTTTPKEKLQIGNSFAFHDGGHKVLGFSYGPSGAVDFSTTQYAAELRFDPALGNLRLGTSSSLTNAPTSHLIITKEGYVGIGATDTKGFKLGVNGKIAAAEVKVATYANWPDFVFENNYDLPTLKEVENHIKDNGHLKDIPSAETVKKDGFFLGEMDSKLLQKIEELTLYTIEQQKEIERLKQLQKQNISQEQRIQKLEKVIANLLKQ